MNKQREKIDLKRYTWVLWVVVVGVTYLLISSYAGALSTRAQLQQRLADFEPKVAAAKVEQEELKERLIYVQSDFYVAQWSQEEARMTLPGETLVVTERALTSQSDGPIMEPEAATDPGSTSVLADTNPAPVLVRWWRALTGKH